MIISSGRPGPSIRTELLRGDGSTIPVELVGATVDFDAAPAIVTLVHDATRERDLQRRLRVAERMACIGVITAGVAHEMNNPLAYVHANLEFAAEQMSLGVPDREGAAQIREALEEARHGCARVRLILRDLKTFSRKEQDRVESVDVRPILESALNIAGPEIRRRARLVKSLHAVPLVRADGARLGQVFLNLLVNAAQSIPDGAADRNAVHVTTTTDERGQAVIAVADTGVGIPAAVKERIFEPFFTTKLPEGTGLGLAICHDIVRAAGGRIEVVSAEGQGAEFRVSLPPAAVD